MLRTFGNTVFEKFTCYAKSNGIFSITTGSLFREDWEMEVDEGGDKQQQN